MLKNILIGIFAATLVVAIGTAAYNTIGAQAAGGTSVTASGSAGGNGGNGNGNTGQGGTGNGVSVLDIPASDLNADEAAALVYMREEEKLARDVYNKLYEIWSLPTFQNIAASEQKHMDEIALLLTRYELDDPVQEPGAFTNTELQDLYNALVAQGNQSLAEALKVGGAIEEIDILDLQERLSQIDNADIRQAFTNLMNGSYSHLGAFANAYTNQTGETYTAQYLTAEMLQSILSEQAGNGNNGQSNGNGGNGQGGNGQGGGNNSSSEQANLANASTIHGTVTAYEYGTLTIQTDDGQVLGIQLGNQNFVASLGFAPQIGEGVAVYGFPGEDGLFSAITITMDSTGQVYTFREAGGRPSWAGGNGNGGGNH